MNLNNEKISVAHIHAYVDAQLGNEDCQRMEDYFDTHPVKFELLQRLLSISEHFQSTYNPVLNEPIPQGMIERVYGESLYSFQSYDRSENGLTKILFGLVFNKMGTGVDDIAPRLYSLLPIHRLKGKPWFVRLKSSISTMKETSYGEIVTLCKTFRLHRQTAPTWLKQLTVYANGLLVNIKHSFREVNLFAIASMVAAGMAIGTLLDNRADSVSVHPEQHGYLESQAIQAHIFYRKEGRPLLESVDEKQLQLLTWVSGRLSREIRLIDFAEMGYQNAGMTLMPVSDNFAMVTVYEDKQSQKLTLTVGLRDAGKSEDITCAVRENTKSLCSWANDKLQYVLVSDLAVTETKQLAEWMKQNYSMAYLISSNEYFFSQTVGTINA